ncbi:MAG: rRNA pseudouridine synthase [Spirochaetes bacterium]|nr:rRNA pseudouridine synthase [Spirochaetota bacterium]
MEKKGPAGQKGQRLQLYLARTGVASRRGAEVFIACGRVSVNGRVIDEPGIKVFEGDEVFLDGKKLTLENRLHYLALNKPAGFICSSSDPQGRPLAGDLLDEGIKERLYSVGRLDLLSCGLIFYTNDGEFAARLAHPASEIEKEYIVEASAAIPQDVPDAFSRGITVEGVRYKARRAELTGLKTMRLVLVEGKNREIRRVFSYFHLHPLLLRRVRIGDVELGNLREGASRPLTEKELAALGGVKNGHRD